MKQFVQLGTADIMAHNIAIFFALLTASAILKHYSLIDCGDFFVIKRVYVRQYPFLKRNRDFPD